MQATSAVVLSVPRYLRGVATDESTQKIVRQLLPDSSSVGWDHLEGQSATIRRALSSSSTGAGAGGIFGILLICGLVYLFCKNGNGGGNGGRNYEIPNRVRADEGDPGIRDAQETRERERAANTFEAQFARYRETPES